MNKCYICHADIIDGVNNRSRFHIGSIAGREKFPVCDSCFEKWTDTVHSGVQAAIDRGTRKEKSNEE